MPTYILAREFTIGICEFDTYEWAPKCIPTCDWLLLAIATKIDAITFSTT
jgi:hypothetical protein